MTGGTSVSLPKVQTELVPEAELVEEIDLQLEVIGTQLAQAFVKITEQASVVTKLCGEVEKNREFIHKWAQLLGQQESAN
eukprot:CAMPEP_0204868662 /NCGR_PEP_ID=MMETSP1348-20121228/27463_1 /ASSEMBLY_ACC=CAM_ASM_000700 /TAXON_ID=215587 /ORGANISM="Aplanochytrium stocchinoi, Strain GSBS06" /LENGTH=79 /DNA_ID=CAMNT_0052021695 /DNA_START=82 /DNA_END=321 /DNA_ORIENTATION=+